MIFIYFLLFIVLTVFIVGVAIISSIFRIFRRRKPEDSGSQQNRTSTFENDPAKKVFSENEGEYVDFEEIKDDK